MSGPYKPTCLHCGVRTERGTRICAGCKETLAAMRCSRLPPRQSSATDASPVTPAELARFADEVDPLPLVPHFGHRRRG